MNRSTRMLLLNGGKDKKKIEFEYEWPAQSHWGPYMPPYYDERGMEPEGAFYDRQGRRHYDNGRYAPMSAYGAPQRPYGEPESARRYLRRSDGRFAPRSAYIPMEPWSGDRSDPYDAESPRMIGFARDWGDEARRSDATVPQYREMDYMQGQRAQGGMAYSDRLPRFDRNMAAEWTHGMQNADGTKGPHWTMEQTTDAMKKHGVNLDPVEFWAVMNSLYSDYCEALKKNNASTMETYVCLAKAWIEDGDAVPDKAAAYYTYVVEH